MFRRGSLKAPLSLIFVQCSSDLSLRLRFFLLSRRVPSRDRS
nr:MAG TPA: hypothetical protein [Caudoviricetes sp.]